MKFLSFLRKLIDMIFRTRRQYHEPYLGNYSLGRSDVNLKMEMLDFDPSAKGVLLSAIPNKMIQGKMSEVEVRIAPHGINELYKLLHKNLVSKAKREIDFLAISKFMTVSLSDSENTFQITPVVNENQMIKSDKPTHWRWQVVPLKHGMHRIIVQVYHRQKFPSGNDEEEGELLFEKTVQVSVSRSYQIKTTIVEHRFITVSVALVVAFIGYLAK